MIAFIPCDDWNALFITNVYCNSLFFLNRHVVAFFEAGVLK